MNRRIVLIVIAISASVGVAGCVGRQPIVGEKTSGLDRKLSTFAYMEKGDLVEVIVDTRASRDRDGQPYMPLEISVANVGLPSLALSRESFTLIDAEGNRYPLAGPEELIAGYGFLDFDRNLAELEGIIFNRYSTYTRYRSNFTPSRTNPSIVRDVVALGRFGFLLDFIYFPTPEAGIRGQTFELFVDSPNLEDPVFVKFEVR